VLALEAVPLALKAAISLETGDIDAAVACSAETLNSDVVERQSRRPLFNEDLPLVRIVGLNDLPRSETKSLLGLSGGQR
jgi:hypothetical protein